MVMLMPPTRGARRGDTTAAVSSGGRYVKLRMLEIVMGAVPCTSTAITNWIVDAVTLTLGGVTHAMVRAFSDMTGA